MEILFDYLGGNCPVQAEGTINGQRFYFRARGQHWSLEINPSGNQEYLKWPQSEDTWFYQESWGDTPFDASWMPEDTARAMIQKAASIYIKNKEKA